MDPSHEATASKASVHFEHSHSGSTSAVSVQPVSTAADTAAAGESILDIVLYGLDAAAIKQAKGLPIAILSLLVYLCYTPFTRSSKHQAGLIEPRPLAQN